MCVIVLLCFDVCGLQRCVAFGVVPLRFVARSVTAWRCVSDVVGFDMSVVALLVCLIEVVM